MCSSACNALSRQKNPALFLWCLWKKFPGKCTTSTLPGNETSLWFAICLLMVHHLLRSHCGERTLLHPSASKSQLMSFSSETSSSAILTGYRKHSPVRNHPPDQKGCCTSLVLSHVTEAKWHASEQSARAHVSTYASKAPRCQRSSKIMNNRKWTRPVRWSSPSPCHAGLFSLLHTH